MNSRHARLLLAAMLISSWFSGCGRSHPVLSGGKPPSYWVQNATSPDSKVRRAAVAKLGNIGSMDPAVVPALIGALHDADPRVRSEAVLALLKTGPEAKRAAPDMETLAQHDRDAKVREYAARAVEKLR